VKASLKTEKRVAHQKRAFQFRPPSVTEGVCSVLVDEVDCDSHGQGVILAEMVESLWVNGGGKILYGVSSLAYTVSFNLCEVGAAVAPDVVSCPSDLIRTFRLSFGLRAFVVLTAALLFASRRRSESFSAGE